MQKELLEREMNFRAKGHESAPLVTICKLKNRSGCGGSISITTECEKGIIKNLKSPLPQRVLAKVRIFRFGA